MERLIGCESVRTAATLWLDRRLSEPARQEVDDHLQQCAECRGEYDELQRLSEATRALQRVAPRRDAAFRARAAATTRATRAPFRPWIAAAAGIVALGGIAAAWWIGLERGRAQGRADVGTGSIAAPERAGPQAATGATRWARAACGVLADLAAIEEVEPELWVALLGSQMRAFDLQAWSARAGVADEPGRELVAWMRELDAALAGRDRDALLDLSRALADVAPLPAAPAAQSRPEAPRFTRTDAIAALDDETELSAETCALLADLLQVKSAWVEGEFDRALGPARRNVDRLEAGPLRAPYGTLFVVAACEHGDLELASLLLSGFAGGSEEPLSAFLRGMRWTQADGRVFSIELGGDGVLLRDERDR